MGDRINHAEINITHNVTLAKGDIISAIPQATNDVGKANNIQTKNKLDTVNQVTHDTLKDLD